MKFLGRRQSSKSNQNDDTGATATVAAAANEDELKAGSSSWFAIATETEESRDEDELNPIENFFQDSASALSNVFSEAVGMADDIKTIISTDIDDDVYDDAYEQSSTKEVVKGSHSDLAKEIKKLGKLEERKKKAKKQIRKCEDEIAVAEAERVETLKKIKALSQKFDLGNVNHDNERDEEGCEI